MRSFAFALTVALALPIQAASNIAGVATVIDGDTIDIHGQRVRLHGVDAPAHNQLCRRAGKPWRCGQQAALALQDHIGRGTVICEHCDTDRYGRAVAVCRKAGEDINAWLVDQGWAVDYRRYSADYVRHEQQAETAKRGIWASDFDAPSDWRRNVRLVDSGLSNPAARRQTATSVPQVAD